MQDVYSSASLIILHGVYIVLGITPLVALRAELDSI